MPAPSIFEFADKFGVESPLGDWLPPSAVPKTLSIRYAGSTRNGGGDYIVNLVIVATGLRGLKAQISLALENPLAPLLGIYSLPVDNPQSLVLVEGRTNFAFPVSLVRLPAVLGPPPKSLTAQIDAGGIVAFSEAFTLIEAVDTSTECDCGKALAKKFRCTRPLSAYGPIYAGKLAMKSYPRWAELLDAKKVTTDEQVIIENMSVNEGNFDSVQSYDSEIVTLGSMQKTVNLEGGGELTQQLYEFGKAFPILIKCLLTDCGWQIKKGSVYYQDPKTGKQYKKRELRNLIRSDYTAKNVGKYVPSTLLAPFAKLGENAEFQDKQTLDFIARLRLTIKKKPKGYKHTVGDFFKSKFGRAVVLDQEVNRPGHVVPYTGLALNLLITGGEDEGKTFVPHPEINPDPTKWGDKHEEYELMLINLYGPRRGRNLVGVTKNPMTSGEQRFKRIKAEFNL